MNLEKFIKIGREAWFETINELDTLIEKIKNTEERR